jgi:hypothetical protein
MAAQSSSFRSPNPPRPALTTLGLILLFGGLLSQAAVPLQPPLCLWAATLLQTLQWLVPTGCQALHAHLVGCEQLFTWVRLLASFAPLLHCMIGVA